MPHRLLKARFGGLSPLFSGLVFLACFFPLLLYILTGRYARFIQDDYCYAVHLRSHGLANSWLHAYLNPTPFSGNRVTLTFFLDLAQTIGSSSVPILPGLMILLWLVGMALLPHRLNRLFRWQISPLTSLVLSTGILAFTLSQAPNLTQVLYWRPGMFPYLAPLVCTTWLLFLITSCSFQQPAPWILFLIVILAGLSGGFSETAAAFNTGLFSILLAASWAGMSRKNDLARRGFLPLWAALFGSLLAMLVLILSPAARFRQEALFPQPPGFLDLVNITLESTRFFVIHSLYRVTLPAFAVGGLGFCLGAWNDTSHPPSHPLSLSRLGFRILTASIAAFMILLCIMAPSAYAEATYPEARVLLMARLVMVIYVGLLGWWLGELNATWEHPQNLFAVILTPVATAFLFSMLILPASLETEPPYPELRDYFKTHPVIGVGILLGGLWFGLGLSQWLKSKFPRAIIVVLTLAFLAQPIFDGYQAWFSLPDFQLRAQMWDFRDGQIRQMASAGEKQIIVQALDSMAGLTELQENPSHWVNNCAAAYYGVTTIRAVEPVLNPPIHR